MLDKFLRRLSTLQRLLRMDERMANVESRVSHIARLRHRVDRLSDRIDNRMVLMDALKSSLEVPPELVDEFIEWKARNPIPERPLVSVIVATYNRPGPLMERCVPSILGQTYDNLELIVVGDCCTDETGELLSAIDDPRLSFINLPERSSYPEDPYRRWLVAGVPPRNRGLAAARGEFITYLDDDDEYTLDRLEKLVKFASEEGCDVVWHPFWLETSSGEWVLKKAQKFAYPHLTTSSVFYRSWFKKIPWNLEAYRLMEPDDWNLFRRIKYMNPVCRRYPEPLHKHYKERSPDHLVSNLFDATRGVE
jgi:glycosyltransferase involved in cell wall biosynthesis